MSDKISVIIPCYNVELYIEKCLSSVLKQTFENLEIIVVDDGSTDSTANIIHMLTDDKRLKYVCQANAGVSAARNAGIDAATGEFLAFVDSDDFIESDMYTQLCAALKETDADMAVCNFNHVYDDRIEETYSKMINQTVCIQDDVYGYFARFCACPKPNNYIWTRLYKTEIIRNSKIRFEQYKIGDDTLFNFKLLPYMNKVTFISEGFYNYYQRQNSNVYTVANKSNLAAIYADTFDALADYYKSNNFEAFFDVLPIHAFSRLRSVFFYSRLAGMEEGEIIENVMNGFKNRSISKYLTGLSQQ